MNRIEFYLFTADAPLAARATLAGVSGIVVDWEYRGKTGRQLGADTEINRHTPEDLAAIRSATKALILCRVNGLGPDTARELDTAIQKGADEILLPMVRRPAEVERVLRLLDARRPLGILVETIDAVNNAADLALLKDDANQWKIAKGIVDGVFDADAHGAK